MDTITIGNFLKQLRCEHGMTQEELGARIGVTNKTVSRWENGNYMPPIECLSLLSDIYKISINEMLAGKRVSGEEFVEIADKNVVQALADTQKEYKKFESRMIVTLIITAVMACVGIVILPAREMKDIIPVLLIVALAFIANINNLMAVGTKRELMGIK